jgi:thiol-disulfide isomerase/thioredoxin
MVIPLLALTACTAGAPVEAMAIPLATKAAPLPDLGAAPELANDVWLNTETQLRLENLRGKVVGLEMWTFGCVNCQNVIPTLKAWDAAYRQAGFVLIANHFPEFDYEGDLENLRQAIARDGIQYAVAQDNGGATWSAYGNNYWPTLYLIDKRGHIRYVHIGEGAYDETERNIRLLLAEPYP